MSQQRYVVVVGDNDEDTEVFGPFTSEKTAEKFADDFDEEGVRPAVPITVVEIFPVRWGRSAINEARRQNA